MVAVVSAAVLGVAAGYATPPLVQALVPSWTAIQELAAVITAQVYLAVVVGHLIAFRGPTGVRDRLGLGRTSGRSLALAVGALAAAWAAAALLYAGLDPVLGWSGDVWHAVMWVGADGGRLAGAGAALFVVSAGRACLLAPLGEEMLFRGSRFGWLRRRLNPTLTTVLTAALFAVIHQTSVVFPLTFLYGLAAGWLREHTGSLTPVVVMHVLNNCAFVAVSYLLTGWQMSGVGMG